VLDDAFADFKGEIEAGESEIALLELLHNVERVEVVVKACAVGAEEIVKHVFAGVAERRMADVMDEREGFGEIGVESKGSGDGAGDLRNLKSVGETVAEMVGVASGEDLSFRFQAAKGTRVDDPIAVAGIGGAVGMVGLGVAATAGLGDVHGVGGEGGFGGGG